MLTTEIASHANVVADSKRKQGAFLLSMRVKKNPVTLLLFHKCSIFLNRHLVFYLSKIFFSFDEDRSISQLAIMYK